jgi:mannose-6-phosphate isomerase-like protein (cupin superfamily)
VTRPIDLVRAFEMIPEPWTPRVAAELNGQHVRLARLRGAFVWHRHVDEDELFLVVSGALDMHLREDGVERVERLAAGQMIVIPRGTEHMPVAPDEACVLLFEPASTLNTGDADDPRRHPSPAHL